MFQLLFISALCVDAFAASFSYGINTTEIPPLSAVTISVICTLALAVSLGLGTLAKQIVPAGLTGTICFIVLFGIGVVKSFESLLKKYILNRKSVGQIKMKISDINFVLTVYADSIRADADNSKVLSPKEAVYLALALSFDSLAAGLGFGLSEVKYAQLLLLSMFSNLAAVFLGCFLGKYVRSVSDYDFSWLGGVLLIILAISKLF